MLTGLATIDANKEGWTLAPMIMSPCLSIVANCLRASDSGQSEKYGPAVRILGTSIYKVGLSRQYPFATRAAIVTYMPKMHYRGK